MSSFSPGQTPPDHPSVVLLVEDNPVIAMNTEALLHDLDVADVQIAGNVADALALLNARRFDLAILDLNLGNGEDSLPIADWLNRAGVPFIFATGLDDESGLPERYASAAILKKPYSFADLERVIRGL